MSFEQFVFYTLAAILVFAATMVITVRNPVHAAMFLVLAFFTTAGVWLLLQAEFLAIALVLVYVGAVMVLFLFVVMMLDINIDRMREGFARFLPIGTIVALLMGGVMFTVVGGKFFGPDMFPAPEMKAAEYSNTTELGMQLYTVYVYPFEIAAVILLLAIVAAIALTHRKREEGVTKYQEPGEQVLIKREDRVRMVEMKAEERK